MNTIMKTLQIYIFLVREKNEVQPGFKPKGLEDTS